MIVGRLSEISVHNISCNFFSLGCIQSSSNLNSPLDQTTSFHYHLSNSQDNDSCYLGMHCLYGCKKAIICRHQVYLSLLQLLFKRLFHMLICLFCSSDISTRIVGTLINSTGFGHTSFKRIFIVVSIKN